MAKSEQFISDLGRKIATFLDLTKWEPIRGTVGITSHGTEYEVFGMIQNADGIGRKCVPLWRTGDVDEAVIAKQLLSGQR